MPWDLALRGSHQSKGASEDAREYNSAQVSSLIGDPLERRGSVDTATLRPARAGVKRSLSRPYP
jgi:hypothetical protein